MVKLVYCLRRRQDVPSEQFHKYWLESHGPLVRSFARALRARRYVQSHTLDTDFNQVLVASRGLAPAYDGITEVWWDSMADLEAAFATKEGQDASRTLLEDERGFIDFTRSRVFMTEEHEIF